MRNFYFKVISFFINVKTYRSWINCFHLYLKNDLRKSSRFMIHLFLSIQKSLSIFQNYYIAKGVQQYRKSVFNAQEQS